MTLPDPYYEQDGVTIYHADCRDVLPHVAPATVALVLSDPPYGAAAAQVVNVHTDSNRLGDGRWTWGAKAHTPVVGDDAPFDPDPLLRFRRLVLWGANHYADRLPPSPSWIVWDRGFRGSRCADAELAWTNLGGTVRAFTHLWDGYKRASEIGFHVHPTQKPVVLMRWILDRWTNPGDLILDPYMGSGPVARACADLGRRYVGVEIVEDYCRIAVDRLRQGALDFDGGALTNGARCPACGAGEHGRDALCDEHYSEYLGTAGEPDEQPIVVSTEAFDFGGTA